MRSGGKNETGYSPNTTAVTKAFVCITNFPHGERPMEVMAGCSPNTHGRRDSDLWDVLQGTHLTDCSGCRHSPLHFPCLFPGRPEPGKGVNALGPRLQDTGFL